MPAVRHVIRNAEKHCRSEKKATPVHSYRINSYRRWKEAKEQCNDNVSQTHRVHNWSENWPHMPRSPVEFVLFWVIPKPFVQNEGDGYHVRGHKTCYNHAYDGVESGGASNIYESEKKGYDSTDENRV
jgi:hypothetical protein